MFRSSISFHFHGANLLFFFIFISLAGITNAALADDSLQQSIILALAQQGQLDSARTLSEVAYKKNPADDFAALMLGKLNPDGKASAEQLKKIALSTSKSSATQESFYRLGQFYYAIGKYNLAIPYFRDYLKLFPQGDWQEPATYWMGNACLFLAQTQKNRSSYLDSGVVYLQKLLSSLKSDAYYFPLAWECIAKIKKAQGQSDQALSAWQKAIDKAPQEELSALLLFGMQIQRSADSAIVQKLSQRIQEEFPNSLEAKTLAQSSRVIFGIKKELSVANPKSKPSKEMKNDILPTANIILQLGVFSQKANAENLRLILTKNSLNSILKEEIRDGKKMYFVYLGQFSNEDAALEFAHTRLKPLGIMAQPISLHEIQSKK